MGQRASPALAPKTVNTVCTFRLCVGVNKQLQQNQKTSSRVFIVEGI